MDADAHRGIFAIDTASAWDIGYGGSVWYQPSSTTLRRLDQNGTITDVELPSSATHWEVDHLDNIWFDAGSQLARLNWRPNFAVEFPQLVLAAVDSEQRVALKLTPISGFDDEVSIELIDAPQWVELASTKIPAGKQTVPLTLSILPDAPLGSYTIILRASGGGVAHDITSSLLIADAVTDLYLPVVNR